MTGRGITWVVVGILIGLRASVRARASVASLRRAGEVYGEAHASDSPLAPPLMAAVGGALCGALSWRFEGNVTVLAHVVLVSACLFLVLVDVDTHVLPRRATYAALTLGIPLLAIASLVEDSGSFGWAIAGSLALWVAMRVLAVLSRGDLGGGDVTLALLLGLFTGFRSPWDVALALVGGFALGGVFALALLIAGRATRRTRFAFGPFLIVGALAVVIR